MSSFRRWIDVVRGRITNDAPERDMDEEMQFHLEMATRRNLQRGMAPDDARRAALAMFGGVVQHQETALDARPTRWLDELRQDLSYSVRTLRRNPGFAASVVLGEPVLPYSVPGAAVAAPCGAGVEPAAGSYG